MLSRINKLTFEQVTRSFVPWFDHWISHDVFWEIDVECVFDDVKDRLATAGISSDVDIGLEVWNDTTVACAGLVIHGFEEQLKALLEACLDARTSIRDTTSTVTAMFRAIVRPCPPKMGSCKKTYSLANFPTFSSSSGCSLRRPIPLAEPVRS